ncbi:peptidase M14 [Salmonella enterica subsp. enterica serovar Abaetetuba]|uniref:peptidase M14 n=1 Tax=Salmonella enterica TaxID=28901 RepID=UPI0012D7058B|nr:peptidase M14 [Salmonella enterica]EBV5807487.1 peptidase M14 [Salmonella enterica subsp. enterica serovar Abaetetuba]EAW0897579.1 peptidase M14 [Salmonella enterica]EAW1009023.1 peptidase M14 [Salmonella enterica]EIB6398552.1 peptidase M14 [Salmonella enterica]EKJ6510976.1 peptidase M14 [Salmonella enterica]
MALEWVDVADSAVKIGLGALITIVGGWITLKLTHRHEIRKEAVAQRLRDIDKKTDRYIDFLSSSQLLMQKYLYESCDPGGEDYTDYMRLHNIVSLTSSSELRVYAFDTQAKVSQFILLRKPSDLIDSYRNAARDSVSMLQGVVSAELLQDKAALQGKQQAWWAFWRR